MNIYKNLQTLITLRQKIYFRIKSWSFARKGIVENDNIKVYRIKFIWRDN
jgi:hypothetical protein